MAGPALSRKQGVPAAAAGLWAAGFLATQQESPPWLAVAALAMAWGIAALICQRTPLLAAGLAGGIHAVALFAGVPLENPAPMAASMLIVYSCGRFIADASGLPALPLLLAATAVPAAHSSPGDVLFGAIIYSAGYAFGRIVLRRFASSKRASAATAGLAAQDPVLLADRELATEREHVAGAALAVISSAIGTMDQAAARAAQTLHPDDLSLINETAGEAVAQLKSLLVELRGGNPGNGETPQTRAQQQPDPRHSLTLEPPAHVGPLRREQVARWLLPSLLVALLLGAEAFWSGRHMPPLAVATAVAVAASLLLRRRSTAAMCVAMASVLALCAVLGAPLPQGMALATCCIVAVWCAAADGRRAAIVGACFLVATLLGVVAVQQPRNIALNIGLLGLTGLAGHAWSSHGRAERASLGEMAELQLSFTSRFDAVLAAGRLESARTIHDVASHAVGAMVMQANAASAQREKDPAAARASLRLVSRIGRDAAKELTALMAGGLGTTDDPGPASLRTTIEQVAAAGTPVSLIQADPVGPAHAAIAYRVIREALFNAVRHASGGPIRISITTTPQQCTISILSSPPLPGSPKPRLHRTAGAGFGLQGLSELVTGAGGFLTTGPVGRTPKGEGPASDFQVLAILPTVPIKEHP